MAYIGNTPNKETVLRLEARKSFALSVWIRDHHGRPLSVADAALRFVMKANLRQPAVPDDSDNLVINQLAEVVDEEQGLLRFNLQATDLNHTSGEYPFAIVLTINGYSVVAAKGVVDIQPNTEYLSINSTYLPSNAPSALTVRLLDRAVLDVRTGPTLAPGTTSFTDEDKRKLDTIEEGAQVNVTADWAADAEAPGFILNKPKLGSAAYRDLEDLGMPRGGAPGEVLVKLSSADYHTAWQQQKTGGTGGPLPADGVTAGSIPIANGVDGWGWGPLVSGVESVNGHQGEVILNMGDINDTPERVAMTPAERNKLSRLSDTPSYNDLTDLPLLGSAAGLNAEDVLAPGAVDGGDISSGELDPARLPIVNELRGFRSGTAAPTGGFDGEIYFQYV